MQKPCALAPNPKPYGADPKRAFLRRAGAITNAITIISFAPGGRPRKTLPKKPTLPKLKFMEGE